MPAVASCREAALALLLISFPATGTATQVVTVSPSHPRLHHVEPVLASSPQDSSKLVVTAMQVENTSLRTWKVRAFWSANAGRTWSGSVLPPRDGIECGGDPWVAWGSGESVYLTCMAPIPVPDGSDFHFHIFLYRSSDGGRSWRPPLQVPVDTVGEWDHPVIVRAPSANARGDRLWIAGTRSTRAGNGTGLVSYDAAADRFGPFRRYAPPEAANHIFAGAVATGPDRVTVTYFTMNSEPPRPYYVVRAEPEGFERTLLRPNVTPWGFPMLASLSPAPGRTALQLGTVWLEGSQAQGLHVWFARSDDEGRTWAAPVMVTGGLPPVLRTHPNVAFDAAGVIAVAWFESASGGPCGDVRVRFSRDGGRTFGEDRVFSRGPAPCPADGALKQIVDRWRGGGDYSGIASPAPGGFDLVWADTREDGHQVRFARIHLTP